MFVELKKYLSFIILIIIAVAVYLPTFENDLQYFWDDQWQVVNDFTSGGISGSNLLNIFTTFNHGQYSPINQIAYTLIYIFSFYDPSAYHCFSLVLHILNACLIYALLNYLLLEMDVDFENGKIIVFVTSVLFVIHPINVEAVAWVSASKIPLYSFFYLLGLLFYVYYVKKQKIKYLLLVLALYMISIGSKEQAVVFPFSLFLLDWLYKRKIWNEDILGEKLIFLVVGLFMGAVTIVAQGTTSLTSDYSFWNRLLLSCYAIFEYMTKTIFPVGLNYLYPYPMQAGEELPFVFYFYPILVLFVLYLIFLCRKNRLIVFSFLFFLINISLSLNILPLGRLAMIADRYLYLGGVGLFLIISYGIISVLRYCVSFGMWNFVIKLFVGVYFVYLFSYSYYSVTKWKNSDTIKKSVSEFVVEIV